MCRPIPLTNWPTNLNRVGSKCIKGIASKLTLLLKTETSKYTATDPVPEWGHCKLLALWWEYSQFSVSRASAFSPVHNSVLLIIHWQDRYPLHSTNSYIPPITTLKLHPSGTFTQALHGYTHTKVIRWTLYFIKRPSTHCASALCFQHFNTTINNCTQNISITTNKPA